MYFGTNAVIFLLAVRWTPLLHDGSIEAAAKRLTRLPLSLFRAQRNGYRGFRGSPCRGLYGSRMSRYFSTLNGQAGFAEINTIQTQTTSIKNYWLKEEEEEKTGKSKTRSSQRFELSGGKVIMSRWSSGKKNHRLDPLIYCT